MAWRLRDRVERNQKEPPRRSKELFDSRLIGHCQDLGLQLNFFGTLYLPQCGYLNTEHPPKNYAAVNDIHGKLSGNGDGYVLVTYSIGILYL